MTSPRSETASFPGKPITVGIGALLVLTAACHATRDPLGGRMFLVWLTGPRLVLLDSGQGVLQVTYMARPDGVSYDVFEYERRAGFFYAHAGADVDTYWTGHRFGPLFAPPSFGFGAWSTDGTSDPSRRPPGAAPSRLWRVQVPYWFLYALCGVAFFVLPLRRWSRLRRRCAGGLCPICGYDLRATPDRCPECGHEPKSQAGRARPPGKTRRA